MAVYPTREVRIVGEFCVISLSQGQVAICDVGDYRAVSVYNWYALRRPRTFYALTNTYKGVGGVLSRVPISMHRFLLNITDPKIEVDHIDGDGLNNRRSNLRLCSKSENAMNSKLKRSSTSGFKGVSWDKRGKKWQVHIVLSRRAKFLGYFDSKEEAARAYNEASFKYHGEFGKPNIVGSSCLTLLG